MDPQEVPAPRGLIAFQRAISYIALFLVPIVYFVMAIISFFQGSWGISIFALILIPIILITVVWPQLYALDYTYKNAYKKRKRSAFTK